MDWDKIEQLFNIGSSAADHGSKYVSIAQAAQAELEEHVAVAKKVIEDRAKAAEEEAGRLRAEAVQKAREAEQAAHDEIQAKAEQQAKDREEKLKAEAETEANAGDVGATESAPVRRI